MTEPFTMATRRMPYVHIDQPRTKDSPHVVLVRAPHPIFGLPCLVERHAVYRDESARLPHLKAVR